MRTPHCHCREPLLLLFVFLPLLLAPTALAYSLADVQKISGFGPACTNAYSTPFKSCTSNDFHGNQGCSTTCASTLAALLANVDEACNGHTANPDTLIGQIFSGEAYDTLCPGSSGSAGSSADSAGGRGGGSNNGNGQASAHLSLATNLVASQASTTLAPKVIQSSTSSYGLHSYLTPIAAPSTTSKPSHSSTSTLSTSASTTLQTSTPTSISTVPLSELTRVTTQPITTTKTAAAATSSSITSSSTTSQETSQGSNAQGAGGGTPFDITSDSCRNERFLLWTMSVVPTAIFVLLWLV